MKKKTLEECFYQIRNGANIKQGVLDGGYPITRIETTSDGRFNRNKMGYAGIIDLSKYESYVLEDGDLLMSHINSIQYLGRTVLYKKKDAEEKIIHGMNLLSLKANKDVIKPEYARYYFCSSSFKKQITRIAKKSVNQASFTVADLKKLVVDVPSLSEQMKIAEILDCVNEVIFTRRQELQKLDDLVKARFVEMFGDTVLNPCGWEKELLGTICDVRDGTHDSPQYFDIGFPLVTSKNVTGGIIDLTDCSLICEKDYKKINERSKVDMGDIIMPMIGTVGKPVIVDIEPNFAIKNVSLIKFKSDSRVLNIYIRALLQSDYFDDAVLSKVRGGTQKFISLGDIRKLEILVPPLELQEQFATFVEQVDKSKAAVQKSLDKLQILFDKLMQEYFG